MINQIEAAMGTEQEETEESLYRLLLYVSLHLAAIAIGVHRMGLIPF